MSHRRIRSLRCLVSGLIVTSSPLLTGCVVGEIRDEMHAANQNLQPLEAQIATGNEILTLLAQRVEQVERANALLEDGNEHLASVGAQLEIMESIQASLTSIDASLRRLDGHLASLRSTIESIDSTIPFLDLGGDEEPEDEAEGTSSGGSDQPGSDQPGG